MSMTGKPPPEWHGRLFRTFSDLPAGVFSRSQLETLITIERKGLGIPETVDRERIIELLVDLGNLERVVLYHSGERPRGRVGFIRYVTGPIDPYTIALSLRTNSYLSHGSALALHDLAEQTKTIYANKEQSHKSRPGTGLTQLSIDRAFRNPPRRTKAVFEGLGFQYVLLNGKQTGRLEVGSVEGSNYRYEVTRIERTLIDAVVRPFYCGGLFKLVEAFRRARGRISVDALIKILRKLGHLYPYHQAVGFLMERAGYDDSQLKRLEEFPKAFDFYLERQMHSPALDQRWRIYYPSELSSNYVTATREG